MASFKKEPWSVVVRGHHDFVVSATEELRARLLAAAQARAENDPSNAVEWGAVQVAFEAEVRALDQVLDPLSGRVRKSVLDWEVLLSADTDRVAFDRWLTRVRFEVRARLADTPNSSPLPANEHQTAPIPDDADDADDPAEPATIVLTAFNARNGHQRRLSAEDLVDRMVRDRDLYPNLRETILREWPDEQRSLLRAFHMLSLLAQGFPVEAPAPPRPEEAVGTGLEGWPWILGPDPGPVARMAPVPANWLVRTVLYAFRPEYRRRPKGVYARRGFSRDTWAVMRSWGYAARIHVTLAEEANRAVLQRIHQGVEAAIAAAGRDDGG